MTHLDFLCSVDSQRSTPALIYVMQWESRSRRTNSFWCWQTCKSRACFFYFCAGNHISHSRLLSLIANLGLMLVRSGTFINIPRLPTTVIFLFLIPVFIHGKMLMLNLFGFHWFAVFMICAIHHLVWANADHLNMSLHAS